MVLLAVLAAVLYLFGGICTGRALVCLFAGDDTDEPAGRLAHVALFLAGLFFWPVVILIGIVAVLCILVDRPA